MKNYCIENAIQTLINGGIISFPTDTVYGIGVDAYNQKAIDKIYKLKKRNKLKPLILFIKGKSELNKYVEIPEIGIKLIDKFWPGKLTIVFKSTPNSPIKSSNITTGIRIPNCEPILTILRNFANPLATTSANVEGTSTPITHLEMNIKPDFIIPGKSGANTSSTIIDISTEIPKLLREGDIKINELEKVIGKNIIKAGYLDLQKSNK